MIAFDYLPVTLRLPGTYVEFAPGARGPLDIDQRQLLIGQKLATGNAASGEAVLVTHPDQADDLFGEGSMLARMYRTAYQNNSYTETWALPLDDAAAGVAATGSIAISGTATRAGTLSLYVGGVRVRIAVASGDTAADIATAAAEAINAEPLCPASAAAADATINLTAKHKGVLGNAIDLRHSYYQGESLPAGLAITVTAMSGGTANPEIAPALAGISGMAFDYFCLPYTDTANLAALRDELEARWGWEQQTYGHGFTAATGTVGELQALGDSLNSQHLTLMGAEKSPSTPETWAAGLCAVAAYHLNMDPARPLQTLEIKGVLPPSRADKFDAAERDLLLHDGVSTFMLSSDSKCLIEACITTYQENAYGAPDTAYLYVNTPATLARLAQTLIAYLTSKFPRHKLADDGGAQPAAGMQIATPSMVRGEVIDLLTKLYAERGWVEHPNLYKDNIVAERDEGDRGRVNLLLPVQLIGQLRRIFTRVEHT